MKTNDELAAMIEQQGAESREQGAAMSRTLQHVAEQVGEHNKRIGQLEAARAEQVRRDAETDKQLVAVNEQLRILTANDSAQSAGMVALQTETSAQTRKLETQHDANVRIEAALKGQTDTLELLKKDKIEREARAELLKEIEEKSGKREGKLINRVGVIIGLIGLTLTLLGTLAAFEVHRSSHSEPPAAVSPSH